MQLYYIPGTCSLAARIVALEAVVPLEHIHVDVATKRTQLGHDYLQINPKGAVPALVTREGQVLTEAAVVIQYLADLAPLSQLLPPAGDFERYRALEWLNYIATELHKGFAPFWNGKADKKTIEAARGLLARKFDYLDRILAGRDYLMGPRFSAPDAYAFAILNWASLFEIELALWPNLSAYLDRVGSRPKVREALAAEHLRQTAA